MLAAVYGYMDVLYSVWIKARAGLTCTLWCEVQRRKGRGVPGEGRLGYGTVGSDFDLVEERRDTRREKNDKSGACNGSVGRGEVPLGRVAN